MTKLNKLGFGTRALHAGKDKKERSHTQPIYMSASWEIRSEKELEEGLLGKVPIYYRLGGNPTIVYVEKKISVLEDGAKTRLCSSGMAAVNMAIHGAMKSGNHGIIIGPVYIGTYNTIQRLMRREGYYFTFLSATDPDLPQKVYSAISERTALVWGEITTNPTLAVWDVSAVRRVIDKKFLELKRYTPVSVAQERMPQELKRPTLIVDPSFSSPYNFRAFEYGADVIANSDTKYRGGHGAFVLGSVTISKRYLKENPDYWVEANTWANEVGVTPGPFEAWLLGEFIKTLHLRVREQNHNAQSLARFLEHHPAVISVFYPGLESHPQYELASRLLRNPYGEPGYGGMVSFRIKGGLEAAMRFLFWLTNHTFIKHKPSLGYVQTIAESPVLLSQRGMAGEDKKLWGITDDLIRISLGVEDIQDIIKAIDSALASCS